MGSIRSTDDLAEMIRIATELQNRLPQLRDDALFAASIPQFLSSAGYKFIIAEDGRSDGPCALGLITFYKAPMIDTLVLVIEAIWFRDESLQDQLWIWSGLISFAQKLDFFGACVTKKSVNIPSALDRLVQRGVWEAPGKRYKVQRGSPVLQGTAPGVYSAFSKEAQSGSAFFAPCIVMATLTRHSPILFCSYSHKDKKFRQELETHLALLSARLAVQLFNDRAILAGADWAKEIDKNLEAADLVLLLISADFMASRYCYGIEMRRALERHDSQTARVVPILVRSCDLEGAPFKHLQWLPTGSRPVKNWRDRDEAWTDVAKGIRSLIEELMGPRLIDDE
jgi:hypothetical protein